MEDGFAGAGAVGEDVEDDFFAVDNGELGSFFPIALLSRGEAFVENDEVGVEFLGLCDEFLGFATAEESGGRGGAEFDENLTDDGDAQIFHELDQLRQEFIAFAVRHVVGLHAEEEGAFAAFRVGGRGIEEVGH